MTPVERESLILESLSLVKHIAYRVARRLPSSVEINDLVNAGVLGLLDAVDKFDPARGVRFNAYAELRIRGAIIDSLRDLDWAPRSLRRKSRELERVYGMLEVKLGRPATDEEVSAAMGETLEGLHALIDQLNGLTIGSFEATAHPANGERLIDYYPDDAGDPHTQLAADELIKVLARAIDSLPEKERLVISLYYFDEMTMKEVGVLLGVNESRVSQLHSRATLRLRDKLRKAGRGVEPAVEVLNK
jgi:RNA polymerase sigma factor for flagellar operon FliA